ncbi:cytochrome P450 CYP82D47-like [Lotus japonicus]|uniref:cytochrome P450 CYP82D47-like n=1 Tax=Lotus japonicus TaxID=34305 RepID=UPI0025847BD9|nr:cytochrome P450 CYP82D47-like [Lotus japonicus]
MDLPSHSTVTFTIYATLFSLFLCILFWVKDKRRTVNTPPPPPEASGAWPLIGHLHLLAGSQPAHTTLGNMTDKYGPIFTLRLGVHRTLVVSNSKMAKECFTVNDKAFASRPKTLATEILGLNFSMFAFIPYGSYWRHVRKIATLEVLTTKRIEILKHVMESEIKAAMKESYNFWVKMKESGDIDNDQKAIPITEMKKWFGDITLNIMFRTVIGKRLVGVGCDGEVVEENERIRKAVKDFFHLSGLFPVSDAIPFLRWLDLDGAEKKMKKTAKELDDFAQVWLEQHKRNRDIGSGEWDEGKHDFMDVLISTVDDEGFDGHDADTIIKATSLSLILAAADTTTATLTWSLSLLLNNREILKKVIHELDTQIGKENLVVESNLEKLEYLQAVIKETLRLYPPGPLGVPHESMEDCIVGGYHVPAQTRLLTNISKLQRDPFLYSNPFEFHPERFLTTYKEVDLKGQHFELIPFGAGRRMCPAMSFALKLMQMTLATLLHGFEIMTVDGGPVDMVEESGLSNIRASPLQVILTPRLFSQVHDQN